jgi:hypothetical protein
MLPINISEEQLQHLAHEFGCTVGTMPFTYLGLPLGITRPKIQDLLPLVDRMERRLVFTSSFFGIWREITAQ